MDWYFTTAHVCSCDHNIKGHCLIVIILLKPWIMMPTKSDLVNMRTICKHLRPNFFEICTLIWWKPFSLIHWLELPRNHTTEVLCIFTLSKILARSFLKNVQDLPSIFLKGLARFWNKSWHVLPRRPCKNLQVLAYPPKKC